MPTRLLILISTALVLAGLWTQTKAASDRSFGSAKAPLVIKVGVTEYQNIEATYQKYEDLFAQLSSYALPNQPVTFTFAIGTYGEVLDWYNKRAIDVAVLSAMPTAELLQASQADNLKQAYLGDISVTIPKTSSETSLMNLFDKSGANPFTYRPGCIVLNADKELQTVEDIQRLSGQHKLKFLFVRPYSLSGYIVPLDVLRQYEIDPLKDAKPGDEQFLFTYQHSKSLEVMLKSLSPQGTPTTHYVAFVLDDTRYNASGIPRTDSSENVFRRIPMTKLDSYSIPREIVLANYNQQQETLDDGTNKFETYWRVMKGLLDRWNAAKKSPRQKAHADFSAVADWRYEPENWVDKYVDVQQAMKALKQNSLPNQLLYKSNFDDLLDDLARVKSPRLALVLSGGGAKCAYQAGAIIEIEKKLREKNQELERKHINKKLDIDLVVGTSGGAINALLVAMGITEEKAAQDELARTWRSFRQQYFLRPSWSFSLVIGICFGLFQTLLIVVAVLLFDRETMNWTVTGVVLTTIGVAQVVAGLYFPFLTVLLVPLFMAELILVGSVVALVFIVDWLVDRTRIFDKLQHWRRVTIVLMLLFGLVEAVIAIMRPLGNLIEHASFNHWIEHLWTLVTIICVWTFPYPFLIALVVVLVGSWIKPDFDWDKRRERAVLWTSILLIFFSGVLVLQLFFKEGSPSESTGIEQAFAQEIPKLVRNTVAPSFTPNATPGKTDLQSLSEQLLAEKLLKRDLIITTSRLPASEDKEPLPVNALPDDLYFYGHSSTANYFPSPPDKRFVPLDYNRDKLLDVIIGSSTIYPIFAPRPLSKVWLGNDSSKSAESIAEMRIIDGGFIHNIPIDAARSWKATHIIVIDASPTPQQRAPRYLWDNLVMAFGYLFKQAQTADSVARAGTFELRPTSQCEKLNIKPVCTDRDGAPEPDMDTFDFSDDAASRAFGDGRNDINSVVPLFVRVPGAPAFRDVTPAAPQFPPKP